MTLQEALAEVERLHKAEVERLHKLVRWNVNEQGNLVRLCRGEHDKGELCEHHEEMFVPWERYIALHTVAFSVVQWFETSRPDLIGPRIEALRNLLRNTPT